MPEQVKEYWKKVKEFWEKFNEKQKKIFISGAAFLVIAIVILVFVMTRTEYETLIVCNTAQEAAEVKKLLDENEIEAKISGNNKTFEVLKEDYEKAFFLLVENDVPSSGYTWESITANNSWSTTNSERKYQEKLLKEAKIEAALEMYSYVKEALVELNIPEKSYSVLSDDEETTANVTLELSQSLPAGVGETLAKTIAYMVGNETTDHIVIMDSNMNVIFSGRAGSGDSYNVSTQMDTTSKMEDGLNNKISTLCSSLGPYGSVTVASHLKVDYSITNTQKITYSIPEDREEGYKTEYHYTYTEGTYTGGEVGAASNDSEEGTTYEIDNGGTSSYSETIQELYALNEVVETIQGESGVVQLDESSVAISLIIYKKYDEDELRTRGLLDDMTFEEFKMANENIVSVEPHEGLFEAVEAATGIPQENISITINEEPFFIGSEVEEFNILTYIPLIVLAVIVALLAFVVYRSTKVVEVTETEPELSVEALLEATKQQPLDEIEFSDKSEARKVIEHFVDENPEAAALLLRNWIESDWG